MSRTGLKRVSKTSTPASKTRSTASRDQQQKGQSKKPRHSLSDAAVTGNKGKASSALSRKARLIPTKDQDEEQRTKVDRQLNKIAGPRGLGGSVANQLLRPTFVSRSHKQDVDSTFTQTFQGLMQ